MLDGTGVVSDFVAGRKYPIVPPLMIPFGVKVVDISRYGSSQRRFTEEDHFQKAFFLDAPHEPLDVWRQIH